MKASETKLRPVLEGTNQYVVPLFQRPYSWREPRWKTLWDDLLGLYEGGDGREHFMGAIVTMPVDMSPHGISKYLLIDGQQRLTTLFLLLACIRDLSATKDPKLAAQISEQYLLNKWEEGSNRLKLLPSQADRGAFQQIVDGKTVTDKDGGIVRGYTYYSRKLSGLAPNGQAFDLKKFHVMLVQQLMVVSIVLHSDENPYLIFESLNAKGEPLTQADLVRNYFLMRIPDEAEQRIAYEEFWLPMQQELRDSLTDFFWRYLTKDGNDLRQGDVYGAMKARLAKLDQKEVVDVLLDMHLYAGYYKRLIHPPLEPKPEVRKRLERLNRWEVTVAYPLLLALYHDYACGRIQQNDMCQVLDMIESYAVRRFFCRIPSSLLNKAFIGMYRSLDPSDLVGSIRAALLARSWPRDVEFADGWERFPIYNSGTSKCRHILESLEERLTTNMEPVDVENPKITIEHVMPQTLNQIWETELGPEAATVHATYMHTIGNLTLTGKNEPMGNQSFAQKKKILAASNLALNKEFANFASWSAPAIRTRAKKLCETAIVVWPRPAGDDGVTTTEGPAKHKPISFTLFGIEHPVKTWRGMLVQTCQILAARHGESFAAMVLGVRGSKRQYVGTSPQTMLRAKQVPGTNLWVDVNWSSDGVLWVIDQMLKACGEDDKSFKARW